MLDSIATGLGIGSRVWNLREDSHDGVLSAAAYEGSEPSLTTFPSIWCSSSSHQDGGWRREGDAGARDNRALPKTSAADDMIERGRGMGWTTEIGTRMKPWGD